MQVRKFFGLILAAAALASCSGGGEGGVAEGVFRLIEFLESGKDSIPRNRVLTFRFSAPVAEGQDFFERLQIENVQANAGGSNFSTAIGVYLVLGEELVFVPRLPQKRDRTDAGFRANGEYTVFLKAGPDALVSKNGDRIPRQQEHIFKTSDFFEDPIPAEPPRALGLVARDPNTGEVATVIDRLDASPSALAGMTNDELIAAGRVIEPGAGAGFGSPWHLDLIVSEPLDPATVTTKNVEMFEIFENATDSGEVAPPSGAANGFGDPVDFKVPINVEAVQILNPDGTFFLAIRVTPIFTLVDNTRYRIRFSGDILGIDFRKAFIGENGLTGDGLTVFEPGGIGYTSEYIARDRGSITKTRMLTYAPLDDGIQPESGQTTTDEGLFNSALYDPASNPSLAVGFLPDFGDGSGGAFSVASGNTVILDTGDTPNEFLGNPFTVQDLNPNDLHNPTSVNPQPVTYDSPGYFELKLASLTVSSSSTLRVIGVNPILFRVQGIVQISGNLDVSGEDGQAAGGGNATGGEAGAGGGDGGDSQRGAACNPGTSLCQTFDAIISSCTPLQNNGPYSKNGEGPGRGMAGAESFSYIYGETKSGLTGTGGGGGSHATKGTPGEDRYNASGAPGTPGPACAQASSNGTSPTSWAKNSSVIGVRGQPGDSYGDREVIAVLWGGSGGGGGGTHHIYISFSTGALSGGGGGGGGGSLAIFAAGAILVPGGVVDVTGGDGGRGQLGNAYTSQTSWRQASGAGGGGSGGSLVLISGAGINVAGGLLDASGGVGGIRAHIGTNLNTCNGCNAGGNGGLGFIFLMDADGTIEGLNPSTPNEYDESDFDRGILTISEFTTDRFSSIAAITELFNVLAANPDFTDTLPAGDVSATVAAGQRLRIFMSSARSDPQEPLSPDLMSETGRIEVAVVEAQPGGGIEVDPVAGAMAALNPDGAPARDAFLRVDVRFEYFEDGVQAALGPFITIDVVVITYSFNG